MEQLSKLVSFFVFPAGVFLAHLIAAPILDLYRIFPNLDIPFHYMGGLSIAYTATRILSYLEKEKTIPALNTVVFLILILSLTATTAVFWEFAEFIGDKLLATNIQVSLANTMQDQFMGILGGATWAFIYYKKNRVVLRV
jgi:hypothetical protein